MFASLRRRLRAQSGSEYMMVISVVTIAVVGAAYAFVPSFRDGTSALGSEVRAILTTGQARGAAVAGGNANANGGGAGGGAANSGGAAGGGAASNGGTLGAPQVPGGGAGNGGAVASNGGGNRGTRHTRNRQTCFLGVCWGTRETAIGSGTGGDGTVAQASAIQEGADLENIDGAWKSFFQGDVAKSAAAASEALQEKPICGPAIIAALTGRSVDAVYQELENNGRLALVKKETTVAGVVVSTSYTTTGVMSESQLAQALRHDYGFRVNEQYSNANLQDVARSLARGQRPIVMYDNGKNPDGTSGHFGIVTDIAPGLGVKVDSATGSVWIPQKEFERRMEVMGGRMIGVSPPANRNGPSVARGP